MRQSRIIIEGWVYNSSQNGVVVSAGGICPCLGCGQHNGVEPKITMKYET